MSKIRTTLSLTYEQVESFFNYDEKRGLLLWKNRHGRCAAGSKAGCFFGYQKTWLRVSIDGRSYDVPSIIWLLKTGKHAERRILHKNGDVTDNTWSNLFVEPEPAHGSGAKAHRKPYCQCFLCKKARKERKTKYAKNGETFGHGTLKRYHSGCKCEACRGANADHHRNYRAKKGFEWVKNVNLKSTFGITLDTYNAMRSEQNHRCAICGISETVNSRRLLKYQLVVDHDHTTGSIRGLLCSKCNRALGFFNDDINVLRKAMDYLQSHKTRKEQK